MMEMERVFVYSLSAIGNTHTHSPEGESKALEDALSPELCLYWFPFSLFKTQTCKSEPDSSNIQSLCHAFVSVDNYKLINMGFYSAECRYGLNIDRFVTIAICMLVLLKGNYHL